MGLCKAIISASALGAVLIGCGATAAQAQTITTLISSTVNDGSFETPQTGSATTPTSTPWTFSGANSGDSGISVNSTNFTTYGVNGAIPDGTQYAFLQVFGNAAATATISQTFTLTNISDLTLSYDLAARTLRTVSPVLAGNTVFSAAIDGALLDTETTSSGQTFTLFSAVLDNVSAGTHTLTFTASQIGGAATDNTALLDNVNLTASSAPEPGALALLAAAVPLLSGGLAIRLRRHSKAA